MNARTFVLAPALCALMLSNAAAIMGNWSPADLRRMASHVVVGTVEKITSKAEQTRDHRIIRYKAAIRIGSVEKGKGAGVTVGQVVEVSYWKLDWQRDPSEGGSGHSDLPRKGEYLRVYLFRDKTAGSSAAGAGTLAVIAPNGFERLSPRAAGR